MAQLTWRNIEAPRLDTRDLALAGQTITSGFDRLSQMLSQREATLRQRATDEAAAGVLNAQSPEELAAAVAAVQANGNSRVNMREIAGLRNTQQGVLQERALGQEELLNMQAVAQLGDEGQVFTGLLAQGKRAEAQAYANEQASTNPLWGRVAYGFGKDGEGLFGDYETRAETRRSNQAGEADARTRTGIMSRELAMTERADRERRQKEIRGQELRLQGEAFADRLNPMMSAEDAVLELKNSPAYRSIQDPTLRAELEAGVSGRYGVRIAPTQAELERSGMTAISSSFEAAKGEAQAVQTALTSHMESQNPQLAVHRLVATPEYQNLEFDGVVASLKNTDINDPAQFVRKMQNRGFSLAEIKANAAVSGATDAPFWSAPANPLDFWTRGTRELRDNITAYREASLDGAPARQAQELAEALRPTQALQERAARLETQGRQAAAANDGKVPKGISEELAQIRFELNQAYRALQQPGPK